MDASDEQRNRIKAAVVATIPKGFLQDFIRRAEIAYPDTYEQVLNDPTTLKEHRLHKLRQDRFFRLEFDIAQAAKDNGLQVTAEPLTDNDWHYTYVVAGDFGITQSHVQNMGELPNSAKYRDSLAAAAKVPRFSFGDDGVFYKPKNFYALIAHNPIGHDFDKQKQKLGSIQFCVPYEDMKGWALEVPLQELLSLYPMESKPVATPSPTWKTEPKKKAGEK